MNIIGIEGSRWDGLYKITILSTMVIKYIYDSYNAGLEMYFDCKWANEEV